MAETPEDPKINPGGSPSIYGPVSMGDHAFIGRDQTNYNTYLQAPTEEKIEGKPSIPRPPRDFVGRAAELGGLCQSVEKGAIITGLHGLGGIGKTALALKAAERLQPNYPDGGIYLDLHGPDPNPLTSEQALEHVIRVFYRTARLPESLSDLQVAYTQALSGKQLLLLLDNARDKAQVAPLLDVLPAGCLALVTSRVHFYYPGMQDQHLDVLPEADAVKLLLEITPRISDKAGELAAACGYLPLALHVIGGLLHEQINLGTEDVLDFMRDAVKRLEMTTADASLELSYRLLPEHLRACWRKLAVFAGDFGEDAAAWVWGLITEETSEQEDDRGWRKAKQNLGELIIYSLVEYKDERYYLHDLARLYAAGKMDEKEDAAARWIHAEYYYQILKGCGELYEEGGEKLQSALAWFDREQREITAGWDWIARNLRVGAENLTENETARLQLCSDYPFVGVDILGLRLHPRERIRWQKQGLIAVRLLKNRSLEGAYLSNLGWAYADLGETRRAIEYYEQALIIDREFGNQRWEGYVLSNLGTAYISLGEVQRAIGFYEQCLSLAHQIGNRRLEGLGLANLGIAYVALGQGQRAIEYFEQALVIGREIGDRRVEGSAQGSLGSAYYALGEVQRAIGFYEQWLAIAREIGDRRVEGRALGCLGSAYYALGEVRRAIGYYEQCLAITLETGDRRVEGSTLGSMGEAYYALGEVQRAIEYSEQALAIARETGDRHGEGDALSSLGNAYSDLDEMTRAIEYYEQSLTIAREIGDQFLEGPTLNNLGLCYKELGQVQRAIEYYEQRLAIARETGYRHGEAAALANLGSAYAALGELQQATSYSEQSLAIAREIGDRNGEANACWALGEICEKQGDLTGAVALMQVLVDYERELGHSDAEKEAAKVDAIRARIAQQPEGGLTRFIKSLFPRRK